LIVLNVVIHVFGLVFINEKVVPGLSGAMEHRRFAPTFAIIMGEWQLMGALEALNKGSPVSEFQEILFLNIISAVIVGETRNSLWNATMVRRRVHGKLSHHALGDHHESGAKSGAREPACIGRIVPAVLESILHVRLAPQTAARGGWPQCVRSGGDR